VSVWRGNDPAECERVQAALENAGIEYMDRDSKNFDPFVPSGSKLEICVSTVNRDAARKIILDEDGVIDAQELTPEDIAQLTLPESDGSDNDESLEEQTDLSAQWYDDDPTTDVWNGESEAFADMLTMCLREVGIASRKLDQDGHWHVVVRPPQETRAKEIVREVVDASPPG
jgi:hypothetical protein